MDWKIPTIAGIQRMTALLMLAASMILYAADSSRAAAGSVAGGTLMIANLYLLFTIGKALVGLAQGGRAMRIGAVLAPFKLLLFVGAGYWLLVRMHLDAVGFAIGGLTQIGAIFIETGRVSLLAPLISPEDQSA
jgi:hypothetical protein